MSQKTIVLQPPSTLVGRIADLVQNRRNQQSRTQNDPLEDPYQAEVLIRRQEKEVHFDLARRFLGSLPNNPSSVKRFWSVGGTWRR